MTDEPEVIYLSSVRDHIAFLKDTIRQNYSFGEKWRVLRFYRYENDISVQYKHHMRDGDDQFYPLAPEGTIGPFLSI